jgi:hypothetical protein
LVVICRIASILGVARRIIACGGGISFGIACLLFCWRIISLVIDLTGHGDTRFQLGFGFGK